LIVEGILEEETYADDKGKGSDAIEKFTPDKRLPFLFGA
jgi:hypothetical protein